MFAGIIYYTGTVEKITRHKKSGLDAGVELSIKTARSLAARLKIGSSINTNGVCLTVTHKNLSKKFLHLKMFAVPETLRLTTLGSLCPENVVNLEPSLRLGDEISGHFVFGHVDGVGTITSMAPDGKSKIMTIAVPHRLMKYFAPKGSVAIDGISLTLIKAPKNSISIALIPHTLKVTNLGKKKPGDTVNIEVDMLARYVNQIKKV